MFLLYLTPDLTAIPPENVSFSNTVLSPISIFPLTFLLMSWIFPLTYTLLSISIPSGLSIIRLLILEY